MTGKELIAAIQVLGDPDRPVLIHVPGPNGGTWGEITLVRDSGAIDESEFIVSKGGIILEQR